MSEAAVERAAAVAWRAFSRSTCTWDDLPEARRSPWIRVANRLAAAGLLAAPPATVALTIGPLDVECSTCRVEPGKACLGPGIGYHLSRYDRAEDEYAATRTADPSP